MIDLKNLPLGRLLGLHAGIMEELRRRGGRPEREQSDGESRRIPVLRRLLLATGTEFGERLFRERRSRRAVSDQGAAPPPAEQVSATVGDTRSRRIRYVGGGTVRRKVPRVACRSGSKRGGPRALQIRTTHEQPQVHAERRCVERWACERRHRGVADGANRDLRHGGCAWYRFGGPPVWTQASHRSMGAAMQPVWPSGALPLSPIQVTSA